MRLIKIEKLENGGHLNQTIDKLSKIPEGYAVIPDDMITENFPFGDLTAEVIDGVMTVTSWTPGEIPEPIPETETDEGNRVVTWNDLAEAYKEGVNSIDE